MSISRSIVAASLLAIGTGGCYEGVGGDPPGAGDTESSGGPGSGDDGDGSDGDEGGVDPEEAGVFEPLNRLSSEEYRNTMSDLLGPSVFEGVELELVAIPIDSRVHLGLDPADSGHLDAYAAVAHKAAHLLVEDPARFEGIGAACLSSGSDESCVRQAITDFGLRALRRPLSGEEVEDFYSFYAEPDDHEEGLLRVFMRLLMAPQLLFHLEIDGEEFGEDLVLDNYVVANRLSYRLLGTMPTPELFAAAAAGELQTAEQLEAQVDLILQDPRAEAYTQRLFEAWMEVEAFPILPDTDPFLNGADPVELRTSAMAEFATFVNELVWKDRASFAELLTSTKAFPDSPELAALYGVDVWSEGQPAKQGDNMGLLQRAGAVSLGTHKTAPILRGVFMLRNVVCSNTPSPDAEVVNSRLDEIEELDPAQVTSREVIEIITGDAECQACHGLINPLTFAMEDLDPLGRKRTTELVYDAEGNVIAEHPVDATVELTLPGQEPTTISGSNELVTELAGLPAAQRCFAQRIYEYTRLRPSDEGDLEAIDELHTFVQEDDISIRELLLSHAASARTLTRKLGD